MSRTVKIVAAVIGGVLLLAVVAVGVLVATFDPNTYKPLLVERLQKDYRRTLEMPGEIRLSFFPNLGVTLGALSLSEAGRADRFASLDSARVSLAVMPLLQRRVVVDRVEIRGLRATLVRQADGRLNIDDLLKRGAAPATADAPSPAASAQPLVFDVAGVALEDAALVFDDQQGKRRVELTKASLKTGRLSPGQPTDLQVSGHVKASAPVLDAQVELKTGLVLDPAARRYGLSKLDTTITGGVAGFANAVLKAGGSADVQLEPLRVDLADWAVAVQGQPAAGTLDAKVSLPKLHVDEHEVKGTEVALQASLKQPGGTLALAAKGPVAVSLDRQRVDVQLAGTLDESRFNAKLGLANFSAPAWRFDIDVDRVDVDRYRKPAAAKAEPAASAPGVETPIDLSPLKALNGSGSLTIGALQAQGLKLRQLHVGLKAGSGQVELNPLAAELYEGRTTGSVTLQAAAVPRISVKQSLNGVSLGPLLKDLLQRDSLEGHGDVVLDVSMQGASVTAMTQSLAGSARVALRDGAVRGFNIAQAIRDAKAKLGGGGSGGTGNRSQSTDFSEMGGSFRIERGVAHTDDLQAKSPLLRVGAVGDVDLGASRLDVLVKATVVNSLKGQGGAELDALSGQTIPVKLSGPFTAIAWKIDFGSMVEDRARQKIEEKAKEKLGSKLKGLLGR